MLKRDRKEIKQRQEVGIAMSLKDRRPLDFLVLQIP